MKKVKKARNKLLPVLLVVLLITQILGGVLLAPPIEKSLADAPTDWLSGWDYRTPIEIDDNTEDLTNYQVQVTLQGTNSLAANYVDFDKVLTGGADIRFTDDDKITEIDFWIEEWVDTSGSESATVWVEVPSVLTAGIKTVYVYYGKVGVSSGSDGDETFEFFDDFEYSQITSESVNKSLVYSDGLGTNEQNVVKHSAETLWTFNGSQYITFIKSGEQVYVGKRVLPDGAWSFTDTGKTVNTGDSHCTTNLGVDPAGYIHIAFGFHNTAISGHYIKSDNTEDISSFSDANMTGANENQVTYPSFFTNGTNLFFIYRNGVSGNGEAYLNKYNHTAATWSALHHPFINTVAADKNPYWDAVIVDSSGNFHISWMWRDSASPVVNHDLSYAMSDDGGTTWKKTNGTTYSMPITLSAGEKIDVAVAGSEIINQNDCAVDTNNHLHVAYWKKGSSGYINYHHAYYNGSDWIINQITNFTYHTKVFTYCTQNGESRPMIIINGTDVIILFRTPYNGYLYAATASSPYTSWKFHRLGNDMWGWMEPNFDRQRWNTTSELHIFAQAPDGLTSSKPIYILETDPSNWGEGYNFTDIFPLFIREWTDVEYSAGVMNSITSDSKADFDGRANTKKIFFTHINQISMPFAIDFKQRETGYYVDTDNWMAIQICMANKSDYLLTANDLTGSGHSFFLRHTDLYGFLVDTSIIENDVASGITVTDWHDVSFKAIDGHIWVDLNGANKIDWTGTTNRTSGYIGIRSTGFHHQIDNFRVRNYAFPEPTPTTTSSFRGYNKIFTGITNTISATDYVSYSAEPTVSNLVDMTITPASGSIDTSITTWNTSGTYYKKWTETGDGSTGNTTHTIGDLKANTYYTVKVDATRFNTYLSNSSGEISFTYTGGYSSHEFEIEEDTTGPTVSLSTPSNNSSTGDNTPTLTWSASDSESGIAKYQLYIDGSLDTDNISSSATSVEPTNNLSCGSHTWYVKAIDNAGNSTNSSTFNLTMACGSGLPPSASNPPALPEPDPENPEGRFSILINNGDEYTNSEIVTLKLYAGPDTERMAISNTEDFEYASQVAYWEETEWDLSNGRDEALPRLYDGEHTVYAKFYTQYGVASEVVSDSIILKTATTETEGQTEDSESSKDSESEKESKPETGEDKDSESFNDSESDETEFAKQFSTVFTETLEFNSNNDQVIQLQNKLKELGFFPKEIISNGNFGPATKQAVIEYQKSKGIYPCGIIGPRTRKALNDEEFITNKDHQFTQDLKYNDKNEEVEQLQTRLRDQNFFPYNVKSTGWFGSITQKAVKFFQKFYNLIQSGIVDSKMREVLNR